MRVKGRWCYLSRAINATGTTIDSGPDLATASQDLTLHVDGTAFWAGDTDFFKHGGVVEYAATRTGTAARRIAVSIAKFAIATAVFATALLPVSASAQVSNPDRAALQALYEAAGGDNWDRDDNWLTDAPLDEWYGVDATGAGQVVALSLPDNNLKGHLPPEIGNLSRLERLDLHRNWRPGPSSIGLTGRIPPEIGNLSNLSDLNLSSNELIGPVPTELAELTNLVRLDIGYNDLMGRIPIELTALPSLAVFDLGFNNLTGSIPPEIAAMTTLTDLNLGGNGLSGGIPRALGNLSLSNLDLGFNNLTGGIPPELGDITTLRTLVLWNNRLTGPIPEELGNLGRLINLMLNDNLLTGPVPESLLPLRLFSFRAANNTSVCIPDTPEFAAWVNRLTQYDEPPLCTGTTAPTVTMLTLSAASATAEGGNPVTVTATLDNPAPATGMTVTLTTGGTATLDTDYTLSSTTITLAEGETAGTVTITVTDDAEDDAGETIVIDAESTSPALTAEPLTLTIEDNDVTPVLALPLGGAMLLGLLLTLLGVVRMRMRDRTDIAQSY